MSKSPDTGPPELKPLVSPMLANTEGAISVPFSAGSPPIGAKSVSGFAWLFASSAIGKIASMAGQIVLARLLAPTEWAAVGLAYTVVAIVSIIANPGIDDILVQRQDRRRRIVSPATWFAVASGVLAALIMLIVSPLAAWAYGSSQVAGLIGVLVVNVVLTAFLIVPMAELRARHDFRMLAAFSIFDIIASQGLTIYLAWRGFGPYSFVVPLPIVAGIKAIAALWLTRIPLRLHPQLRRWPLFLRDSGHLFITRLFNSICGQGDYVTLGLLASKLTVGEYFFAFNVSTQFIRLIAGNISLVLISSFAQIKDNSERLSNATAEAGRLTAAIVGPTSMGVILVADPLVRLLYGQKWIAAISLIQILTVGSLINASAWPVPAALTAAGRMAAYAKVWIRAMLLFIALVPVSAYFAGAWGTACAVATWQIISSCMVTAEFAERRSGFWLPFIWSWQSIGASTAAAVVALLTLAAVQRSLHSILGDFSKLAVLLVPYGIAAATFIMLLDRRSTTRIFMLLRPKLSRLSLLRS